MEGLNIKKDAIIKQCLFVKALNNNHYLDIKSSVKNISYSFFNSSIPTTVIAQTPENNFLISLEINIIKQPEIYSIINKSLLGFNYIVIQSSLSKMVISGGLSFDHVVTDIFIQSQKAFEIMNSILQTEGLGFPDVIRQWNYIENITGYTDIKNTKYQNYQIFNNLRSEFYDNCNFINGYPAATGIGTYSGGVIIDFIALKGNGNIYPLNNPLQIDAYKYSHEVLDSNKIVPKQTQSTPKFERAKLIRSNKRITLFISGTAAIRGEHTIPEDDAVIQTQVTLENIHLLLDDKNLSSCNLLFPYKQKNVSLLRVYVKKEKDIPLVAKIVSESYINSQRMVIQGDICRNNLLVEIEGVIEFEF
jgi:enamine deaminase RidA (YjgF/YER057c/UK114 family)